MDRMTRTRAGSALAFATAPATQALDVGRRDRRSGEDARSTRVTDGIELSDDPILVARRGIYEVSVARGASPRTGKSRLLSGFE